MIHYHTGSFNEFRFNICVLIVCPMNDSSLVKVEHLCRYYGALCAVNNISFEIQRGEVLGFLGPNGAGKSTTMQMISGNLAPSAGQILIHDIDILDQPRQAKAHLGYLPEQPPLYRELTVDEYLTYCARLNQISRANCRGAVDGAKERCGLTTVGKRLIGNLSKGYQQRVGIAQAIIHTPAVIILDEPTVGLDPIQIREIRTLIRDLSREHSVILSTHILPEVQAICDRVLIIHQGVLVLNDTIAGLQRRMEATVLIVAFRHPPAVTALEYVAGVETVETLDKGRFRIHYLAGQDPTDTIVGSAVADGWGLVELTPERMSLEDVFINITRTESATVEDETAQLEAGTGRAA